MTATVTSEPIAALAGPVPPPPVSRPRVLLVGTAFVCAAIAMLFAGLIGVYLSLRTQAIADVGTWVPVDVIVPLTQPNMMMFTLVLSVFTIQWAVVSIKNDDRPNTYLALGVSLLLAFSFIVEEGYLYSLMKWNLASAASQSSLVYAITGAHLVMIISAMVFVILMGFRALAGQFTSRQHDGIAAAALYWHVMVAVYALIWYVIFVTK
jgi:heme/copper-type cytochrome/quinol oxidase subunit 3